MRDMCIVLANVAKSQSESGLSIGLLKLILIVVLAIVALVICVAISKKYKLYEYNKPASKTQEA